MTTFVCVYQRGGTERFVWTRALPVKTYAEAEQQAQDVMRMGYPAYVFESGQSDRLGLPTNFCIVAKCTTCFRFVPVYQMLPVDAIFCNSCRVQEAIS